MQKMVIELETQFPASPTVGRIVFKDKRVYMCVELVSELPVWVALTNELNTYVHRQTGQGTTWNVAHNLNTTSPTIQIYDSAHKYVIPDDITIVDNNNLNISFGFPMVGTAVLMFGDATNGATRTPSDYVFTQATNSTAWVINHDLGYFPITRIFIGNVETLPDSITHTSIFSLTVNFTTPQVGVARLV